MNDLGVIELDVTTVTEIAILGDADGVEVIPVPAWYRDYLEAHHPTLTLHQWSIN